MLTRALQYNHYLTVHTQIRKKSTRFLCLWHFKPCSSCSVYSVYFWGFCHFLFFIVPIYRVITKNITESTLGKSTSTVIKLLLPSRVYRSWATILQGWVGSSGVISGSFGWVGAYSAQRLQLLTVSLICWLMPGQNKHLWPVKDMPALLGDLRECASLFLCEMQ